MTPAPAAPGYALTIALGLAGLALTAFAAWRHGLPPNPTKGPRMIPWIFILLLGATLTLVMAVHLVNLFGFKTGRI